MQALIGLISGLMVTLLLGWLAATAVMGRRRQVAMMADGTVGTDTAFEPASPRNDAGETGRDQDRVEGDTQQAMGEVMAAYGARGPAAGEEESMPAEVDESPIVRLTNTILQMAIKNGASDIHLEPDVRGIRGRLRIDGILHEVIQMPRYIIRPLTARYKVLADVDLLEHQLPQTGRVTSLFQGKEYDMNVCFLTSRYGVKTTIRIYDLSSVRAGLETLGLSTAIQTQLTALTARPTGLVLLAGPVGSGRSTFAYTLLNSINTMERNIATVEDAPPTYRLNGITQVYVDRPAGRTLPKLMAALRQQDTDVILLDATEQAEELWRAVEAAQDHLVIATIHANDALSALNLLLHQVIDPALIASTLSCVVAMRLARRVCKHCGGETDTSTASASMPTPQTEEADGDAAKVRIGVDSVNPRGCEACRQTGVRGRIGIHEMLAITPALSELIAGRVPVAEIRSALRADEQQTLQQDARAKVDANLITAEEMARILPAR